MKRKNKLDVKEKSVKKLSFRYKHPMIITIISGLIMIAIITAIISIAIYTNTVFTYDDLKISKEDLIIKFENSTVYDSDGNFLATLSSGTKRKCISLEEMGEYIPNAYIAIEDERFYEHFGVDFKRTTAATLSYLTHFGSSDFGGSSITQQVVKNITHDKEDSANRKIKEMSKAIQVEKYLDKKQILELYLNIIFIGGNDINGVELGAKYYFDKTAKELTLAQAAFMAGINHAPNGYKPFKTDDEKMKQKINTRTKTVLNKMLELEYINKEQYDGAIAEVDAGLAFVNGDTSPTVVLSYQTEAALDQIVNQIVEEKGLTKELAEMQLYSGGYKIFTTQKTGIQDVVENELRNTKYLITNNDQSSMATFSLIENNTGNVIACGAGIGEDKVKTQIGNFNYPTRLNKQTGSSMKPISVIAPGLESGVINASSVFYDGETSFGNYSPKNYYAGYKGPMTMRTAIEISANVPNVKALSQIGVDKAKEFCESVGITGLGDEGLALALGGLSNGTTSMKMAGAYSAIANGGVYIEPTFYSKVVDSNDNVYIQCKPVEERSKRVMSEQNAYIEKDILESVVKTGTATYCSIPGMSVAAKTGTTNNDYDRWLCGFTPYYTAACWYGYERSATVYYGSGNPAGQIWSAIMRNIHTGLESKYFERPADIVDANVCRDSGLLASSSCGNIYVEKFVAGALPRPCDGHVVLNVCAESGLIATSNCPNVRTVAYSKMLDHEQNATWNTGLGGSYQAPVATCPMVHFVEPDPIPTPEPAVPITPEQPTTQETTPPQTPVQTTPAPTNTTAPQATSGNNAQTSNTTSSNSTANGGGASTQNTAPASNSTTSNTTQ